MKKIPWFTKAIAIVLAVVIIYQPLTALADDSSNSQNSSVNSVNVIKAETITGNYRGIEITFNTPVRFVDNNPATHIFVADSAEPNPSVNGSWQIGLDNTVENGKTLSPVTINGTAYAIKYDLTFAEDINKSSVLRITEDVADTNDDLSSIVCNSDGLGLTANLAKDNAPDIASVSYFIKDILQVLH